MLNHPEYYCSSGVVPVGIAGDSAGATLCAVVAHELSLEPPVSCPLAFQILVYPFTEGLRDTPSDSFYASGFVLTSAIVDFFNIQYVGSKQASIKTASDPCM